MTQAVMPVATQGAILVVMLVATQVAMLVVVLVVIPAVMPVEIQGATPVVMLVATREITRVATQGVTQVETLVVNLVQIMARARNQMPQSQALMTINFLALHNMVRQKTSTQHRVARVAKVFC